MVSSMSKPSSAATRRSSTPPPSGGDLFKVSQSKVKAWRKCRQAYYYRYVESLRKKVKARPLTFGSLVHEMIEAHASGEDAFRVLAVAERKQGKLFRAEYELYGNIIDDVRIIMTDYFAHHKRDDITYLPINGQLAEHKFEVPIGDGIVATGLVDAYATKNKLRWMVEHKTFGKQMPDEDARWRDLQSSVYIRIGEMLGWPRVDGLLWDYIRSKPPQAPAFLKNGKVARRLIDTLPTKIIEFVAQNKKQVGGDATRLLSMARKNETRYFRRIFVPTKPDVIGKVFADFTETAREMRDLHGKRRARTIDRHCSWCDFEGLCRAELRGGDVDFLKEKDFEVSKKERREIVAE